MMQFNTPPIIKTDVDQTDEYAQFALAMHRLLPPVSIKKGAQIIIEHYCKDNPREQKRQLYDTVCEKAEKLLQNGEQVDPGRQKAVENMWVMYAPIGLFIESESHPYEDRSVVQKK